LSTESLDGLGELAVKTENDLGGLKQLGDHSGRRGLTTETRSSQSK
jgi:hypothetical protein